MIFHQLQDHSLMTPQFSPSTKQLNNNQKKTFQIRPTNGKCLLILIYLNKLKN